MTKNPISDSNSWSFQQSTGYIRNPEYEFVFEGYSGCGKGKNNPAMQNVKNVGVIPLGYYTIGEAYKDAHKGQLTMTLTPDSDNEMYGRSGFLIHGDSIANPGTASEGCIIANFQTRQMISLSECKRLQVIE